ncbi:MAG: amidase family protein, partial [Actinomycetota bacterium]
PPETPAVIPPTISIGVPRTAQLSSPADAEAWGAAVQRLHRLPHVEVIEVDLETFVEAGDMLYGGPWVAERYSAVGRFLETGPDGVDPVVASIILSANRYDAVAAYEAAYRLAELRAGTAATWERVDVLVTPTTPGVATLAEVAADPVGRNSELGVYTNFVNLLDLAALAIPADDRADGLPFGVSVVGPAWSEDLLAEVARRFGDPTAEASTDGGPGATDVVVVGAHLEGQPLNWQLTDLGGVLVQATTTAPEYRLHALTEGPLPKPALERVPSGTAGASIEVEVWRIPTARVGVLLSQIPEPLGLGRIHLVDGSWVTGFIAEPVARDGALEITELGGWRAYLASREG